MLKKWNLSLEDVVLGLALLVTLFGAIMLIALMFVFFNTPMCW